ncbi:MAG: hypothetical protein EPO21_00850 [Chloroflexota bacterium]|nr:MAG: hypothetical protein EPO21_00850 [Chloroflexota bacterium]
MASVETLTSLAILKVNIDQGGDYLDYLRPFILQVLVDQKPDPVTDVAVRDLIRAQFGLEIPARTVQIVLKRISRQYPLKREIGVYRITGTLPNPGVGVQKAQAERHIEAVVSGLMEFSKDSGKPLSTADEAVAALCGFLGEFSIPCLRAYLCGTAIPTVEGKEHSQIVLVSDYVLHLQRAEPNRFDSLLVVVQGHMLANALLCPDLQQAPKSYKGVTFFLDTPLLVQQLGLEGDSKKAAVDELIRLLHNLGATVATFSHSREELEGVIRGAADHVNVVDGRGSIVMQARRSGTTKSDLLVLAGRIDERLVEAGIGVQETPPYIAEFQIDENIFEKLLEDEVAYFNPRAREFDINSVRSIYVLRAKTSPSTVEQCRAVLVSSNSAFARAAYNYGQNHEEWRDVSSVITDFSLANMAWLKAPMGAPSLPTSEVLAFSYAALQPSKELLDKYLVEIDKLQKQGRIGERDHQLLRSSTLAQDELMHLTMGEESALTEATVTETLRRVTNEIKKEESEKLSAERTAHCETQQALARERLAKSRMQERLFWSCRRRARWCARGLFGAVLLVLVLGIIAGFGVRVQTPVVGWALMFGSAFLALAGLGNLVVGVSLKNLCDSVEAHCLAYFLRNEAKVSGIDLEAP